jgi:hypothetical protein
MPGPARATRRRHPVKPPSPAETARRGAFAPWPGKSQRPNLKNLDPAVRAQLSKIAPGKAFPVDGLWGFTTVSINVDKVKAALRERVAEREKPVAAQPVVASTVQVAPASKSLLTAWLLIFTLSLDVKLLHSPTRAAAVAEAEHVGARMHVSTHFTPAA